MAKRKGKRAMGLAERRYYSNVGQAIRKLRLSRNLYHMHLAQVLSVNCQQIQKYENGEHRISIYKLSQLAEYFEEPLDYFTNFKNIND